MECRVKPYEGTEARTAIIHVSDDDTVVYPLIERLSKYGLRIWHDSDIRKVMVEYKKNWKKQQTSCDTYLVFLSENAVNSHVFRERLTSAVESRKQFIVINTLDQNKLSIGMRLQIEKAAKIVQSSYIPKEKLTEEIINIYELKECIGASHYDIEVTAYPKEQTIQVKCVNDKLERSIAPSDRTVLELRGITKNTEPAHAEKPEKTSSVLVEQKFPIELTPISDNNSSLEETIRITENDIPEAINLDETFVPHKVELPIIVSLMSGEKRKGVLGESVVGRAKKIQGAIADISFTDECKLFSGKHFSLIYIDNICMLICKHPNGMNVNGQEMQEGDKFTVESDTIIQIPSNTTLAQLEKNDVNTSYFIITVGNRAKNLWDADAIAFLKSRETGEIRVFTDHFKFGRGNAWKTGVMVSRNISRDHGSISLESGRFCFQDHSINGTLINGTKINNESFELHNDDIISVHGDDQYEESYIFHSCIFEKG